MTSNTDLGQNDGMPSRVPPSAQMPDRADRFYTGVSGRARIEVLRYLLGNPNSPSPAIASAVGLPMATVRSALVQLEQIGYITSAPEGSNRRGKAVTYSVDEAEYDAGEAAFLHYLRPRTSPAESLPTPPETRP